MVPGKELRTLGSALLGLWVSGVSPWPGRVRCSWCIYVRGNWDRSGVWGTVPLKKITAGGSSVATDQSIILYLELPIKLIFFQ